MRCCQLSLFILLIRDVASKLTSLSAGRVMSKVNFTIIIYYTCILKYSSCAMQDAGFLEEVFHGTVHYIQILHENNNP